jgi:hypothetical protein
VDAPVKGQGICCAFRSEKLRIATDEAALKGVNSVPATLVEELYRGKYHDFTFETPLCPIRMRFWDKAEDINKNARLSWSPEHTVMMPK